MIASLIKKEGEKLYRLWNDFWFSPQDLLPISVFRFFFCFSLFVFHCIRFLDYEFFYSEKGILPYATLAKVVPESFVAPIPWEALAAHPTIGWLLHLAFLIGLLLLALGVIGRNGTWIVFILHLVFIKRNPMIIYGADLTSTAFFFMLCFTQCNEYLRVRLPWQKKGRAFLDFSPSEQSKSDLLGSVGIRFIQVQLCIIYAYAGFEKTKGPTWWKGDAIWNSLGNGQLTTIDFSFLQYFPVFIAFMTFATIIWETYFIFLVWYKPLRYYILGFGVFLHIGIAISLNIPFFSLLMVCAYLVFLEGKTLRRLASFCLNRFHLEDNRSTS